ncbi:MAG: TonB family protein [Mariprofundaceae bacterium]|nr:TonB family protein [Mariprofundaceae bacterium]
MSQSLAANHPSSPNHVSLSALDIAAAVVLHLLILAVVLAFGLWHRQTQEIHFKSVKVHLISAHQLERLQHRARPKTKHHKPKIKPKPMIKPKPTPVLKLKPKPVLKHKAKLKPKAEDNFDPFKPMESTTDVESAPVVSPKAAQVFQGQLSKQEVNRYIAMMQAAVLKHWKVSNIGKDVQDPLVEMVLNPDGSVREVRILESSGNVALDASLVRAIKAASPFQVPREQFELFRNNTIRFRPLR